LKKAPEVLGNELGVNLLKNNGDLFSSFNVIKGFLNLSVTDIHWADFLEKNYSDVGYGIRKKNGEKIMVEYSSPNTNKPLHLGHLRNNFLGWSLAEILKANGYEVVKTCIVNDRGIHICKSMIAWQLFANGATPESTGTKGDHFVGDYYVKFNDAFRPVVQGSLGKTDATKYWNTVFSTYNKIPFTKKVNTDLIAYVTDKALAGIFYQLALEEQKIRKDPVAQTTELLKKVFGK